MTGNEMKEVQKICESYGVYFHTEDGRYKTTYAILNELSLLWNKLNDKEIKEVIDKLSEDLP